MSAPRRTVAAEFGRFLEIQNLGLNLPFALAFFLTASSGHPSVWTIVWVLVAFVAARNAGHSFNRIVDVDYDRLNPRTQGRALVTGRFSRSFAIGVVGGSTALFLLACYFLNLLALLLAPVALAAVFGYSYSKRVTSLTTALLGVVEGIIPAAVYIAVQGRLPVVALVAALALVAWGTAFETIHSLGDVEADRAAGLSSLPVRLGVRRSSRLVPVFHAAALLGFAGFGWLARLPLTFDAALAAMAVLLVVIDARLIENPTKPNRPFRFHIALGLLFLAGTMVGLYLPHLAL